MTQGQLIRRSLVFFRRLHLPVVVAAAVSTILIVGALGAGDSVRHSLQRINELRLGKTDWALAPGQRFFTTQLARELERRLQSPVVPLLQVYGTVSAPGRQRRMARVQILGVDQRFWRLGKGPAPVSEEGIGINRRLARGLGVQAGDAVVLRFRRPADLPEDAPFSLRERNRASLRVTVTAAVPDQAMGRFSLRISQTAPATLFLPYALLARLMEQQDRANVLLLAGRATAFTPGELNEALRQSWRPGDAGLELADLPEGRGLELRSRRIFLEPAVEQAALALPGKPRAVFTYFVNSLEKGLRATPYSMVSAAGPALYPERLPREGIVANSWLAADLGLRRGDVVTLRYLLPAVGGGLRKTNARLPVVDIIPLAGAARDPQLMPPIPGLADADSCREWKPGIPIDLGKIRDKDEAYWNRYRGTPKAFVSLETARSLWGTRFGSLTAVRFRVPATREQQAFRRELEQALMTRLDPEHLGLRFHPVRREAEQAGNNAINFGELFLGLSFFLVVAALLLTAMVFRFAIEERRAEAGLCLCLGFSPARVRRILLREGALLAAAGVIPGALLGVVYNQILIEVLGSVWRGAVGTSTLQASISPLSLLVGAGSGLLLSLIVMWVSLRRLTRVSPIRLLGRSEQQPHLERRERRFLPVIMAVLVVAIVLLILAAGGGSGFFFAGAALLLGTGLLGAHWLLLPRTRPDSRPGVRFSQLAWRNLQRKRQRSLAVLGALACGMFLVVAVSANRKDFTQNAHLASSGTGGFVLWGETSQPLLHDLNSGSGQQAYGLDQDIFQEFRFMQLPLREGDDASCLNLNRIIRPKILGVDATALARRSAFTFTASLGGDRLQSPWLLLEQPLKDGALPVVADQTVIVWGMNRKLGDTIAYTNSRGEQVRLRLVGALANSIFQGNMLMSRRLLQRHFPGVSGSRVLLVDGPQDRVGPARQALDFALADQGARFTGTARRLAEFNQVENTYLNIFLSLGGLGLLLGSVGLALVVLRSVMERRGELALLQAVGWSRRLLFRMLMQEHVLLLAAGTLTGTLCGLLAVVPVLAVPGSTLPLIQILILVLAMPAFGLLWVWLAARAALRGELLDALREE